MEHIALERKYITKLAQPHVGEVAVPMAICVDDVATVHYREVTSQSLLILRSAHGVTLAAVVVPEHSASPDAAVQWWFDLVEGAWR